MDDVVITIFEKISNLAAKAYEAYKHVKYFKKFSTEIYDRIEAGAHHFKYLQRHEKKIKEKFRDQDSITNLQRYVIAVTSLTNLLVEFSELHQLKKYLNSLNYKDKIIEKIKRYDETIRDLNLEVSLENLESVENLYLLVEEGFNDVSQTMVSMKNNMDNLGNNMEFLMEMVAGVNKSIKELSKKSDQSDFKKNEFSDKVFDGYKLTDPPSGEDSRRGKVFKKLFNRVQPVACKPFEASTNEKEKELFNGYLTILSNLQHSNSVIAFYGVSCVDGKDVLVFDWAELGTLKEVYEKNPEITWKQKLKIAHDICLGLQFIHECQLFHCDVRCENILIMGPDIATPKITNFFLSRKQMDMSKKIPSLNDIMPWMAPEKLDLKGRYTTKCEIYSFGMLLWELAFQQVPYLKRFNSNYEEISLHVKSGQREYLNFDNKDEIQRCFNYIISKAWHKKLESRPNMPDILKILEKLYKKHYFTRSKSYCENTTYGSLDDDDFDFNVTNEFIKSDTCELDFKEIGTSTVEDAIKLHKERADESRKQAWKYFEYHSDTLNNFTAKYWKGYYLLEGLGGVKKDPKMAMELFKEAADNDVASAQFHYAFLISQNADNDLSLVEECITYLEKAADNGNLPALFNLGNIYYNGKWNIQQDIERGVKYYKMSAVKDHDPAIKKLKELKIKIYD
ncbi:11084_t:CDS:2 [Entrophospora sp. SA101]|nr:6150_t:CDS:2 [Entrophospora sp. SA101]CAJ0847111.1 11084_t:CDS:2 [Entrophospora sp. SA101]